MDKKQLIEDLEFNIMKRYLIVLDILKEREKPMNKINYQKLISIIRLHGETHDTIKQLKELIIK